jgi:hypothetical protein
MCFYEAKLATAGSHTGAIKKTKRLRHKHRTCAAAVTLSLANRLLLFRFLLVFYLPSLVREAHKNHSYAKASIFPQASFPVPGLLCHLSCRPLSYFSFVLIAFGAVHAHLRFPGVH